MLKVGAQVGRDATALEKFRRPERGAPVSYRYSFEDLLALLHGHAPAKVDAVALHRRRVEHGHLSVGLKIHCLGGGSQFSTLVEGLGGAQKILDVNYYKHCHASLCLVLPPVGSARSAILLLECIEHFIGSAGHAQRADDAVRPPSPERVRVKAPADLRNCTGKAQGDLSFLAARQRWPTRHRGPTVWLCAQSYANRSRLFFPEKS